MNDLPVVMQVFSFSSCKYGTQAMKAHCLVQGGNVFASVGEVIRCLRGRERDAPFHLMARSACNAPLQMPLMVDLWAARVFCLMTSPEVMKAPSPKGVGLKPFTSVLLQYQTEVCLKGQLTPISLRRPTLPRRSGTKRQLKVRMQTLMAPPPT